MLSWLEDLSGVKGSRPSRSGAAVFLKGNTGDPWRGFSYSPAVTDRYIASLQSRMSVHGEEPYYPTRGDPVMQNTANLKE